MPYYHQLWFSSYMCVLLALMLWSTQTYGQHVDLPTDWSIGRQIKYERTRHTQHYNAGYKKLDSTTVSDITLSVRDKSDDGFIIRWTIGETNYTDPINAKNQLATSVVNLMKGVMLDFRTDRRGRPQALISQDSSIQQINGMIQNISQLLRDQGASEAVIEQSVAGVQTLTDPAQLESTVIKEPIVVCRMLGASLVVNELNRAQTSVINPFDGPPLPAITEHALTHINTQAHEAIVEWRTTLDDERAYDVLHAMFVKWAQKKNKPIPRIQDLPRIKIEESTTYVIDTTTGWPLRIEQQRISINGTRKSVERLIFRVQSEP